jgi:hypothetical protein
MTTIAVRRRLRAMIVSAAVVLALVAVVPSTAYADSTGGGAVILAGDSPLDGSQQPAHFVATITPPAGVASVKFVLDGVYLGQSTAAPFQFSITAAAGSHHLAVHWDGASSERLTASFTVAGSTPPPTKPTPPPVAPTPPPVAPSPPPVAPPTTPVAPPTTPTTPTTPPVSPPTGVVAVSTSAQLVTALATAQPGQTIALADGTYVGTFTASASGRANAPITLRGSRAAVLSAGGLSTGYGLHITGSYWLVQGISVTESGKGIVLDGSQHTVISGVDVGFIGDEGVHFRHNSAYSSIIGSIVHDTGLKSPGYGEGIYIGSAVSNWASVMGSATTPDRSDYVMVEGNHLVNTAAEGVDIKEGTTGGALVDNVFTNAGYSGANSGDSWVDVKGNGYVISGNSGSGTRTDAFQVHQAAPGWGNNTVFSGNTPVANVPGYLVNVGPHVTGTVVACQATGAALGLSNIACTG